MLGNWNKHDVTFTSQYKVCEHDIHRCRICQKINSFSLYYNPIRNGKYHELISSYKKAKDEFVWKAWCDFKWRSDWTITRPSWKYKCTAANGRLKVSKTRLNAGTEVRTRDSLVQSEGRYATLTCFLSTWSTGSCVSSVSRVQHICKIWFLQQNGITWSYQKVSFWRGHKCVLSP